MIIIIMIIHQRRGASPIFDIFPRMVLPPQSTLPIYIPTKSTLSKAALRNASAISTTLAR
jgi:hypothetical protein